jgi:type VI secretion system protein ImpI/type VI secretion system protein
MDLVLSVIRCPDAAVPATRRLTGGELAIGRGEGSDWVLADPNRHLSKHHCTIAFRAGRWTVTDHSTNGTFLDRGAEPLGRGASAPLRDGSRLVLGEYEIEVRLEDRPDRGGAKAAPAFDDDPFAPPSPPPAPFQNDPFGRDPFASAPQRPLPPASGAAEPFADPFAGLGGPAPGTGQLLPDDFDPLADVARGAPLSDPSWTSAGSRPDHMPASSDAFVPPPVVKAAIPDDWDLDAAPTPSTPAPSIPAPSAPMPVAPVPASPAPAAPEPADLAPVTAAPGADLMAAFLAGAGLPDLVRRNAAPPEQLMRGLGAAFRAFVEGLREVLITRATIKSEFRIEQTIIAARGNNPLKFSPSVEDALAAMLGEARGAFMDPEAAVRDSLDDIKHHELATMRAMQDAVRAVLAELDPARLRAEADAAGGLALVPAQRRARAFDLLEARFAALLRDVENTTDGTFARAFARAYEAAGGRD